MRNKLFLAAGVAAIALSGVAHAQLLGGGADVTGGVVGGAAGQAGGLGANAAGNLGVGADVGADVGGTVQGATGAAAQAAEHARMEAEATALSVVNTAGNASVGANAEANADVAMPGVRISQRQNYEHGSHVYVENRGWVWVPSGARLQSDGTLSGQSNAALSSTNANAGANISGGAQIR